MASVLADLENFKKVISKQFSARKNLCWKLIFWITEHLRWLRELFLLLLEFWYFTMFTIVVSPLNYEIWPRRWRWMKEHFTEQRYILPRHWEKWLDYRKIIASRNRILSPSRSCISKFNCARCVHSRPIIYAKWRNARDGKRRGTRDSTSHESIREKSRVGQLTRRRAISGSERGIKGAWESRGRMGKL